MSAPVRPGNSAVHKLLDYDAAHAGDLVTSVRVWLEHDRQTDRAATALHIHPNTCSTGCAGSSRSAAAR